MLFGRTWDLHNYIKDFQYNKLQYWVIPNYTKDIDFYKCLTGYNKPVYTAPYVWDSKIIDLFKNREEIKYQSKKKNNNDTKYIIIAEPNNQITKTCMIPLLICEELYKVFENIRILCICKPKSQSFINFCNNLLIHKENKVEYYDRIIIIDVISQLKNNKHSIFFLSHQRDNPLNFLHLEVMYLDYPLIHNSNEYKDCGYYYNDINGAVKNLLNSFNNHDKNIDKYKSETKKILDKFSPNNKQNQNIYLNYIKELLKIN